MLLHTVQQRRLTVLEVQEALSDTAFRVHENLARRILKRRWGFKLIKNRRRDREAPDFGLYAIIDPELRMYVAGGTPWAYARQPIWR